MAEGVRVLGAMEATHGMRLHKAVLVVETVEEEGEGAGRGVV